MFRAIGFVIILYALSVFLDNAFTAFENAVVATFETVEQAATVSTSQLQNMK